MNEEIGKKIKITSISISRNLEKILSNVTRNQGIIIKYINENSNIDVFQKDIEKKLNIRSSTVSQIITSMEKKRTN